MRSKSAQRKNYDLPKMAPTNVKKSHACAKVENISFRLAEKII